MNLPKQVRKAAADALEAINAGEVDKARYILSLLTEMVSEPQSRWQPWSYYSPRILEEYGEE